MKRLSPIIIAFATYSRIPMPNADWSDRNRRLAMVWFPLVGAVIGLCEVLWLLVCQHFGFSGFLQGTVGAAVPLLITGGIHMDGFMDMTDAMASWKSKEERLAILKDSHVGAFAVMGCCLYLLFAAGVMSMGSTALGTGIVGCFMASRALCTLTLLRMKRAVPKSSMPSFEDGAQKRLIELCAIAVVLIAAVLLLLCGLSGAAAIISAASCVLIYRHRAYKYFGGITGDLSGWFVQVTELTMLACLIITRGMLP